MSPAKPDKYRSLPQHLRSDPQRLSREFLDVAIDPKERFDFRSRALVLLSSYADDFQIRNSAEAVGRLMSCFEKEFSSRKLDEIAVAVKGGDFPPEAFLAHLFCVAFAALAPEIARDSIEAVRMAIKDTELGDIQTKHLEAIKRKRGSPS